MRLPNSLSFKRSFSTRGSSTTKTVSAVGIIGLFVKFIIPMATGAVEIADDTKNLANARTAVSLCSSARAAGLNFEDDDGSVLATLVHLSNGDVVKEGVFEGSFFQLPMTMDEMIVLQDQLEIRHGCLVMRARAPGL